MKFSVELVIPGLITAGAAIGCGLARRHQARRLAHLLNAQSSSIAELHELQATVAQQLGGGSFKEHVKLSAEVICNEPLIAPWSGESCVAYRQTITNLLEVRKESTYTDSEGRSHTEINWERRDETLSELERRCDFKLRQGANNISFTSAGAEMELETVFNTVDPPQSINSLTSRSLGVRRTEDIFRASGMVFVLAECNDANGELCLEIPSEGGTFVVHRGNEEDFNQAIRSWRRIWSASAIALAGTSLIFFLLAIM